ncbi:hypothetical protein BG004_007786 [Podila humilis]|nr:hypothetical protein BG004_007786 [Podila humilis]
MATPTKPTKAMTFYDIAMRQPIASNAASPNPWKSRMALNFKNVDYTTTWVPLPEIAKVRQSLQVEACRKFGDGSKFYTLPILVDPNTNSTVGDSFDIAIYLQQEYPDLGSGNLFPPQNLDFTFKCHEALLVPLSEREDTSHNDYARFNQQVDGAFTTHTILMAYYLPFDPASVDASRAEFIRRSGVKSWEDFEIKGEAREKVKESLHAMLGDLGKLFSRDTSGPFLLGQQASYADLIVGGWLQMMRVCLPADEWKEIKSWHGGIFGRLADGLEKFAEVK